jgi:mannitol-1-phosphate 5-dehydrogenase
MLDGCPHYASPLCNHFAGARGFHPEQDPSKPSAKLSRTMAPLQWVWGRSSGHGLPMESDQPIALIFGAGKVARGFLGHLLSRSGYEIWFVDKNPDLITRLETDGAYPLLVMVEPPQQVVVEGVRALHTSDLEAVAEKFARAEVILTAVGGPHLPDVAWQIARGVERRWGAAVETPLNILIGENYYRPADLLKDQIRRNLALPVHAYFDRWIGLVELQILRSCIEPTAEMAAENPLWVRVQDEWRLPADGDAFKGAPPLIEGLQPTPNFQGGLERKLYTYNAANAAIAYAGYLKGYALLADAANDPQILALARGVCAEAGAALVRRHGFDPDEQRSFAEGCLAKYQNRAIVDPVERNARDPLRKLGRHDRLVGPACLCLEFGIAPEHLATAIAAALQYDPPADPRLQCEGLPAVLKDVCGIDPDGELGEKIRARYDRVREQFAREALDELKAVGRRV